jgi:DNA polymerase I-like protein with 3'-5' exonuclease and polymerase domains
MFRSRHDGWVVGEADGAQLEFRVAVHLGRDEVGQRDIINGTDVHSVTAGIIGCTRQDAKAHTFKPLYGGRSGTPDQKRYYEHFRKTYQGVTATQQRWIDEVLDTKSLRTEWGMRFHWPDTKQDKSGYVTNTTSISNYPVQSFATAEIIPLALVCFWHRLRRSGLRLFIVNTVHDSIICEIPPDEIGAFHTLSRIALIDDVYDTLRSLYGIHFTAPLGAGVKCGTHWNGRDCAAHVPGDIHETGVKDLDADGNPKGEVLYTATKEMYEAVAQNA